MTGAKLVRVVSRTVTGNWDFRMLADEHNQ
jgi:hypothetical protein